jgi:uncharacterized peroxidase-related enzyme
VNNELKTMMRLAPIENDQVSRELSASLGETATTFTGLPNFLRVLANAPAALKAYVLADAALGHGQTTPRERELIALLVAEINGCSYSLLAHCELAKNIGLSDDEIRLVRQTDARDPHVKAMLYFVQAVVLQRGDITEEDFRSLRQAGFGDAQIIEIIANIALNIFTNYFNTVAKTEVDYPLFGTGAEFPVPAHAKLQEAKDLSSFSSNPVHPTAPPQRKEFL